MKKILGLTVAALMVMGLVGGGTWAYFNDPEAVAENAFQAGTIDLHVNGEMAWSGTIGWTDAKPGASDTLAFENAGTINGVLTFATTGMANLVESDDDTEDASATFEYSAQNDSGAYEMSEIDYAKLIEVTDDGTFVSGLISGGADTNGDSKLSLHELYVEVTTNGATYNLNSGATLTLTFTLYHGFAVAGGGGTFFSGDWDTYGGAATDYDFHTSTTDAWNVPQADGCKVDISVTLEQAS